MVANAFTKSIGAHIARILAVFIAALIAFAACGCTGGGAPSAPTQSSSANAVISVSEDGSYITKDEVAAYIHEFGHLPSNFISKTKARKAGWVSSKGNLQDVCPGMSIGGSVFYNDDGLLPDAKGRTWTECDIGYEGGFRGAERIVFSNDGLVFYTGDHYKTFEQLY
ncbi:MAG: ribonuclease domain-containing protein [Coriobacteriia bacterium]|nr:ribonuclease domain-containing protein [Coriobacteriia bacterium]